MTEEQKKRLDQRLRELKERLDGKPAPTVKESALLTELQPGYLEVLMRRFRQSDSRSLQKLHVL